MCVFTVECPSLRVFLCVSRYALGGSSVQTSVNDKNKQKKRISLSSRPFIGLFLVTVCSAKGLKLQRPRSNILYFMSLTCAGRFSTSHGF